MLPVNNEKEIQDRIDALKLQQEFASVEKIYRVALLLQQHGANPELKKDKAERAKLESEFNKLKQCPDQKTFQPAKEELLKTLVDTFDRYDTKHDALKPLIESTRTTCDTSAAQAQQFDLKTHQEQLASERQKLPMPILASHLLPQLAGAIENIDAHTRVVAAFGTCCTITENLLAQKLDPDGDLTRDVDGMHKAQDEARKNNEQSLQEQTIRLEDSAQKVQTRLDKLPQPKPESSNVARLGGSDD